MTAFWTLTVPLIIALSILSYVDIKTLRLPDEITLPLIIIGFLKSLFLPSAWIPSLIGGMLGYALFVSVEVSFKNLKGRSGLGRGDAKLMAAAGTWLGYSAIPKMALFASLMGLAFILLYNIFLKTNIKYLPFGPFLSFAFIALWFYSHYYGIKLD